MSCCSLAARTWPPTTRWRSRRASPCSVRRALAPGRAIAARPVPPGARWRRRRARRTRCGARMPSSSRPSGPSSRCSTGMPSRRRCAARVVADARRIVDARAATAAGLEVLSLGVGLEAPCRPHAVALGATPTTWRRLRAVARPDSPTCRRSALLAPHQERHDRGEHDRRRPRRSRRARHRRGCPVRSGTSDWWSSSLTP